MGKTSWNTAIAICCFLNTIFSLILCKNGAYVVRVSCFLSFLYQSSMIRSCNIYQIHNNRNKSFTAHIVFEELRDVAAQPLFT